MEKLTRDLSSDPTGKLLGNINVMPAKKSDGSELLQTPLHGVFIPAALVVFGTALVKWQWTGYAVILAAVLSAFKFYRGRTKSVLKKDDFQEFPLTEKTILTHNTAVYRFALPAENNILGLPIGQHVVVSANINGKDIARSYTPTSSDDDRGYFDLLIKSYPTGNISRHFASLQLGQSIKVKGPKGNMVYTPNMVRAIGMIAGGTGITPMLQVIRAILKDPEDKTEISLIFANVNPEDILLREDLDDLAAKNPQLKISYVLNNPPAGWTGSVGFVTSDLIREKCPAPADDIKILICGPPPMVSAMKKATLELGYQKTRAVSKLEDQVFVF